MSDKDKGFVLNRLVMHRIKKTTKSTKSGFSILSKKLLDIENEDITDFAKTISDSYHKRTSKEYGKFKTSPKPTYQVLIEDYLNESNDNTFLEFTSDATNHLKDEMNKKTATGGYLIFADYKLNDRFIIAVLLNDRAGFAVNEKKLEIELIKELNIEQIAMASFLNVSIYQSQGEDRRYISFMKGKKDITEYFSDFIGADESKETSAVSTKHFVNLLNNYLTKEKEFNTEFKDKKEQIKEIKMKVFNICDLKIKNKEALTIENISKHIDPELPNGFFEYVNTNEDIKINNTIESLDRTEIRRLKVFKYSNKGISLSFDRELYTNGDVYLSENKDKLIIKTTDELKDLMSKEFKD